MMLKDVQELAFIVFSYYHPFTVLYKPLDMAYLNSILKLKYYTQIISIEAQHHKRRIMFKLQKSTTS